MKIRNPRKSPEKWIFLSLAFYNAPSLDTVDPSLCFAIVPSGPCGAWGRRCRTHVASLSKCDTACPSYARHTLNCVFKHVKTGCQHSRTFGNGLLCQRKGSALSLPIGGVLRAFVCVGCARSKPIGTKVSRGGITGRTTGRASGHATGHVLDSHLP